MGSLLEIVSFVCMFNFIVGPSTDSGRYEKCMEEVTEMFYNKEPKDNFLYAFRSLYDGSFIRTGNEEAFRYFKELKNNINWNGQEIYIWTPKMYCRDRYKNHELFMEEEHNCIVNLNRFKYPENMPGIDAFNRVYDGEIYDLIEKGRYSKRLIENVQGYFNYLYGVAKDLDAAHFLSVDEYCSKKTMNSKKKSKINN